MTAAPRVWNVRDPNKPKGARYIGRGTPHGNPFVMGRDGNRDMVCDRFEFEVLPTLDVSDLRGCDLICHCAPARCHGDSILRKANAPDERDAMNRERVRHGLDPLFGVDGDGLRYTVVGERKANA